MLRVPQQDAVGVRVGIDEPGGHGQPGGVDNSPRPGAREVAHSLDAVPLDSYVGPEARRAAPVHYRSARYQDIEHCLLLHISRKLLSRSLPTGVMMDSGWNCMPSTG